MHMVMCVYVSNRQMYAETGRWEDVLGIHESGPLSVDL